MPAPHELPRGLVHTTRASLGQRNQTCSLVDSGEHAHSRVGSHTPKLPSSNLLLNESTRQTTTNLKLFRQDCYCNHLVLQITKVGEEGFFESESGEWGLCGGATHRGAPRKRNAGGHKSPRAHYHQNYTPWVPQEAYGLEPSGRTEPRFEAFRGPCPCSTFSS